MKFEGSIPPINNISLPLKKFDNGHWLFPEQLGDGVGFIYVIRDNILKRFYLGKKTFRGAGKLNYGKESNWRRYTSSSNTIATLLKERPFEEFDFIVLEQYKAKGALSYAETWTLCLVEAPTNVTWYNTRIEKVSWPVKERITERHKRRLEATIAFDIFEER
jgi:hypothetical protein